MKFIKLIIVLSGLMYLLCSSKCRCSMGEWFYRITIINNSQDTLIVSRVYEDTLLPDRNLLLTITVRKLSKGAFTSQVPYDEILKKLSRDTLSLFFFDYNVFSTTDWDEIRENRMFLMRYELSSEDLKKLNFKIPYPPTEAMEGMKKVLP